MNFRETAAAAILPAGFASLMDRVIANTNAQRPPKAPRRGLLSEVERAIMLGNEPPLLEFASTVNYTYNRHAKALYERWQARNAEGLEAYPLKGTNTYARALSRYRDLLLANLRKGAA